MVELEPSKLKARVRFPLGAPFFAVIAQLVEHRIGIAKAPSSNLGDSTTN